MHKRKYFAVVRELTWKLINKKLPSISQSPSLQGILHQRIVNDILGGTRQLNRALVRRAVRAAVGNPDLELAGKDVSRIAKKLISTSVPSLVLCLANDIVWKV